MNIRTALPLAALLAFSFGIGVAAPSLIWPEALPTLGMCAPGSRGNACTVYADRIGAAVQIGSPNTLTAYPPEATAICADRTASTDPNPATACSQNGGIADWLNATVQAPAR